MIRKDLKKTLKAIYAGKEWWRYTCNECKKQNTLMCNSTLYDVWYNCCKGFELKEKNDGI